MSTSIEELAKLRYEPTRVISMIADRLERASNGEEILTDPSLPLVQLLDWSCIMTAGAINEDEILTQRMYAVMAKNTDDLYHHYSDKDFEGLFSNPAVAWMDIYLSRDELINNAVRIGDTGTRKLTIGKHTSITVNGAVFTMQYPITFIVKSHGSIDIVYDGSRPSPLQTLESNKVEWQAVKTDRITEGSEPIVLLALRVPVLQMLLTSYTYSLTSAKVLRKTVVFSDYFYYARAFSRSSTGEWVEIKTTHSQQVFDATDPTVLLSVSDQELTIELPHVYFLTDLVTRDLRVDVYTTKGPIVMAMGDIEPANFVVEFKDLDNDDNGIYTSGIPKLSTMTFFSTDMVSGGRASMTFEEIRERVLNNSIRDSAIPISDAQLSSELLEEGFDVTLYVDDVTTRLYSASKPMPKNNDGLASTGVDTALLTLKETMADLVLLDTVVDNGNRITIRPNTLYQEADGLLNIVPDDERLALDLLRGDALVNSINGKGYLYSPFHYVLDANDTKFEARPYYLTSPSFGLSSFEASNDTLGLTVGASNTRSLVMTESGYVLTVMSESNDVWKALADNQVHVQIAFIPEGESDYVYANGEIISGTQGGERVFQFNLDSRLDILDDHRLIVNNFTVVDLLQRDFPVKLKDSFSLIWSVSDYTVPGATSSEVDLVLGRHLLPADVRGVYHESMKLTLGEELSGMWARARSMIGSRKVMTYSDDVPKLYQTTIYQTKPGTNIPETETDGDGNTRLIVLHKKGDPVMFEGEVVYEHRKGDAMLDEYGRPIYESERMIVRWVDLVLFDGVYRYANTLADVTYRENVSASVVDWVNDVLAGFRKDLIENTDLLFRPRNTLKSVTALIDDGAQRSVDAAQYLKVYYYVVDEVYRDNYLRESLTASAVNEIVKQLESITVTREALQTAIKAAAGVDVVSVAVEGLGGDNYNVITLLEESSRLCLAKNLFEQADGTLAVVDAVEINFLRHVERGT